MTRTSPDALTGAWLIVDLPSVVRSAIYGGTQRPSRTPQEDRRRAPVLLVCRRLRVLRAQPIWNELAPRLSAAW